VRVVVSGASGLIGSALVPALRDDGHQVLRLVRRPRAAADEISWDPAGGTIDTAGLAGIDAAVNLNGAAIDRRWTSERKKEILASRIDSTRLLATTLAALELRPRVLVCAGGVDIYGDRGDEILTEESETGASFLAEVGVAWEAAAEPARSAGIRVVSLRQGFALSTKGGALARMLPPFRFGVAGRIGSGKQWWSWVSLDDLLSAYRFALDNDDLSGPVNAVCPNPVTNAQFTNALGKALRRPTLTVFPAFAFKAVYGAMGEETVLGSKRAVPARLLESGFSFSFPNLDDALSHVFAE
jgi:uncharacterized protein (TIGR01777 family)